MFQRILVPLDGSARAEKALPVAARIARASGGSIRLLEVISIQIDYRGGLAMTPLMGEQQIESETTMATDYLQTIAASPELAGIQTTTGVVFGSPAQCILAETRSGGVDLIVLCSHGRTGFTRWVLGSVAHAMAHESPVPILVLRENDLATRLLDSEATHALCALVPLDGSELAETALAPATHLVAALAASAKGASLHLAQVVKSVPTSREEGFVSEPTKEALQQAEIYLASMVKRLQATEKEGDLSLTCSVEQESDVADALVKLAENKGEGKQTGSSGCDLIAISTHGRHGLQRWVMGSVTSRILTTTKLPMLIVRPPAKGAKGTTR